MTQQPTILIERAVNFRKIVLNRPDILNAFSMQLHAELIAALRDAEADADCRALLITGAGRAFCAGQDLTERVFVDGVEPDLSENLVERYNPLISFIQSSRLPIVAAVNGVAAGAGASLALSCDVVLAARSAKFVSSFSKIGLVPDAGISWNLPRLVGDARARAMLLLGQSLDAERAAEWGLIAMVVDDAALESEATSVCEKLAATPGDAISLTKRALHASANNNLEEQLQLEADLQRQAGVHPDYRTAVDEFRRKQIT